MADTAFPMRIDVPCMGYVARRALRANGKGTVGAVFERSFYLKMPETWICILGPCAAMGPLVLRSEIPPGGIDEGMAVSMENPTVLAGSGFLFSYADATTWTPPPAPAWTRGSLRRGVEFLIRWMERNHGPDEGLGELVLPRSATSPRSATAGRAAQPIGAFRTWLAAALKGSPDPSPGGIDGLIGLGPGLTPSGDDFLGGAMIGLHLVGKPDLAARLSAAVLIEAARFTTAISQAHLAAAAEGGGSEWLHAALDGVLAGDAESLPRALRKVGQIGHTSGWDALAGAVTVFAETLESIA
jgi:hypothetical protein